jgi:hypothetical protein
MARRAVDVAVVIPAYNEERRLKPRVLLRPGWRGALSEHVLEWRARRARRAPGA